MLYPEKFCATRWIENEAVTLDRLSSCLFFSVFSELLCFFLFFKKNSVFSVFLFEVSVFFYFFVHDVLFSFFLLNLHMHGSGMYRCTTRP